MKKSFIARGHRKFQKEHVEVTQYNLTLGKI